MASFFTHIRVAVLMGGPSAEHKVSLRSGTMVLKYLDPGQYKARGQVDLSPNSNFGAFAHISAAARKNLSEDTRVYSSKFLLHRSSKSERNCSKAYLGTGLIISSKGRWPISLAALRKNYDVAFIAMHGEYGEDGTVQEILEKLKMPFTGSGSLASRLGMDKIAAARLFQKAGLKVPPSPTVGRFPVVIKPADRGSSVGVTIAHNAEELAAGLKVAKRYSRNIIAQKFISGREFTCGVLEINGQLQALPPTEIIPVSAAFFDYKAKYKVGGSREITPPNLAPSKIKQIQTIAETAHNSIGARGFSRTDMIMDKNGKLFVLEINTIPGLTKTSLLPQQAAAAGITFPKLLDLIINSVLITKK